MRLNARAPRSRSRLGSVAPALPHRDRAVMWPEAVRSPRRSRPRRTGLTSTSLQWEERRETNGRFFTVEVKIGVSDSPRELILSSAQTPAEVEKLVSDALESGSGVLALTDEK